jgi:ABC-type multidrug transport system fused ATPase/permease subunit
LQTCAEAQATATTVFRLISEVALKRY